MRPSFDQTRTQSRVVSVIAQPESTRMLDCGCCEQFPPRAALNLGRSNLRAVHQPIHQALPQPRAVRFPNAKNGSTEHAFRALERSLAQVPPFFVLAFVQVMRLLAKCRIRIRALSVEQPRAQRGNSLAFCGSPWPPNPRVPFPSAHPGAFSENTCPAPCAPSTWNHKFLGLRKIRQHLQIIECSRRRCAGIPHHRNHLPTLRSLPPHGLLPIRFE